MSLMTSLVQKIGFEHFTMNNHESSWSINHYFIYFLGSKCRSLIIDRKLPIHVLKERRWFAIFWISNSGTSIKSISGGISQSNKPVSFNVAHWFVSINCKEIETSLMFTLFSFLTNDQLETKWFDVWFQFK